jgi:hypothetical protein
VSAVATQHTTRKCVGALVEPRGLDELARFKLARTGSQVKKIRFLLPATLATTVISRAARAATIGGNLDTMCHWYQPGTCADVVCARMNVHTRLVPNLGWLDGDGATKVGIVSQSILFTNSMSELVVAGLVYIDFKVLTAATDGAQSYRHRKHTI